MAIHKQIPSFAVREGAPSDCGFIAQHWVDAYVNSFPRAWVGCLDRSVFNRFCYQAVEDILKRAQVRIVGPPDDAITIYGCAVLEPSVIHFVFVRPSWRRMGLAKALLEGVDIPSATVTTWSPEVSGASGWILGKYKSFRYVPFFMREGDDERKRKVALRYG